MQPEFVIIVSLVIFFVFLLLMVMWRHSFLRKQAIKLAQVQKLESVGRLAGGVAHDFNNMLTGIRGAAEFMDLKFAGDVELHKYTQIILSACDRASGLISQLLVFSRKKEKKLDDIDINQEVEDVVCLLEHGFDKKITIKKELRAQESALKGNKDLIQSLVSNLVFNAKDAIVKQGEIVVSTKNVFLSKEQISKKLIHCKSGSYIELCIRDNGLGIPKHVQPHIFEPFFTTKPIGKGNGLGLAEAYGIITEHKGTISFETSNKGTAFYIYFPCRGKNKVKKIKKPLTVCTKAKVFVVDDEKILLELLNDILKLLKADVNVCSDPLKALDFYKDNMNDIDVVMLDVIMPNISGVDLYKQIRKINKNVKIIFMSGYNPEKQLSIILNKDKLTGFIHKPYTISECSEEIRRLIKC